MSTPFLLWKSWSLNSPVTRRPALRSSPRCSRPPFARSQRTPVWTALHVFEKIQSSGKVGYGYNAYTEEFVDMIPAGIVDPTKVTRSALENAASIGACVLTTESLVVDKPDPAADAAANAAAAAQGGMY